jgi:VanZ family protein
MTPQVPFVATDSPYASASASTFKWRFAVIAWIALIFFSSTSLAGRWCEQLYRGMSSLLAWGLPSINASSPWLHFAASKSVHLTLFAVFGILMWQAASSRAPFREAVVLLSGLAIGSCSEFLQSFFPDRDPALRDVGINVVGTALGLFLVRGFGRRPARRSP